MAGRRVPLEERVCDYAGCGQVFTPARADHRFHDPACKVAWWRAHYATTPHPCPFCHAVHDPEDPSVLDALEMLVRLETVRIRPASVGGIPANGTSLAMVPLHTLEAFLRHRRANC